MRNGFSIDEISKSVPLLYVISEIPCFTGLSGESTCAAKKLIIELNYLASREIHIV